VRFAEARLHDILTAVGRGHKNAFNQKGWRRPNDMLLGHGRSANGVCPSINGRTCPTELDLNVKNQNG
jgi:hypothetical protein